jgi:hypothetical protein
MSSSTLTPQSPISTFFPSLALNSGSHVGAQSSTLGPQQGQWIAVGTVAVCMVGALGVGLRPILRRSFSAAATAQAADTAIARASASVLGRQLPQAQAWMSRLKELQERRVRRNPLRFGREVL